MDSVVPQCQKKVCEAQFEGMESELELKIETMGIQTLMTDVTVVAMLNRTGHELEEVVRFLT